MSSADKGSEAFQKFLYKIFGDLSTTEVDSLANGIYNLSLEGNATTEEIVDKFTETGHVCMTLDSLNELIKNLEKIELFHLALKTAKFLEEHFAELDVRGKSSQCVETNSRVDEDIPSSSRSIADVSEPTSYSNSASYVSPTKFESSEAERSFNPSNSMMALGNKER